VPPSATLGFTTCARHEAAEPRAVSQTQCHVKLLLVLFAAIEFTAPFFITPHGGRAIKVSARSTSSTSLIEFHAGPKLLKRDTFEILGYEGAAGLAFVVIHEPKLPNGLVLAVAHQVGADGVNTESALYRVRENQVLSLWKHHCFLRFSQEALCVGNLGHFGDGIAQLRMDDSSGCVMCDHAYLASVSVWRGSTVEERNIGRTKGKYSTGAAAAREFGIVCKDPIITLVARPAG
jgi:hypothetical protein